MEDSLEGKTQLAYAAFKSEIDSSNREEQPLLNWEQLEERVKQAWRTATFAVDRKATEETMGRHKCQK